MSKKIYEKDYNAYRLVGDDNMINMITKYTLEVEDMQKQLNERDFELKNNLKYFGS